METSDLVKTGLVAVAIVAVILLLPFGILLLKGGAEEDDAGRDGTVTMDPIMLDPASIRVNVPEQFKGRVKMVEENGVWVPKGDPEDLREFEEYMAEQFEKLAEDPESAISLEGEGWEVKRVRVWEE